MGLHVCSATPTSCIWSRHWRWLCPALHHRRRRMQPLYVCGPSGHRTAHLRGWQRWRCGDQVRRPLRHGGLWLAGRGQRVGRRPCADGPATSSSLPRITRALVERRRTGAKAPRLCTAVRAIEEPAGRAFSTYYFFVFGAFVALALWLPHYLIDVYAVDVRTAGMAVAPSACRPRCSVPMAVLLYKFARAVGHALDLRLFHVVPVHACPTRRPITSFRARTASSPSRPAWGSGPSSPRSLRLASS